MSKIRSHRLPPRTVGLLFLIPGLVLAVVGLMTDSFSGGILGFSIFAVVFGLIMTFIPFQGATPDKG